jgi:hypothetical protein
MWPGTEKLIRNIEQRFKNSSVDDTTYRQWMTTDRSTSETALQTCRDLLKTFAEKFNIPLG